MGARTAAAFRIDQNNTVAEYTVPERAFDSLFDGRVVKPNPIQIVDDEGAKWSLSPDRQFIGTNVLVQIDGVYHRTRRQERKSRWEDEALLEKGFKFLHIDSELLTVKKYHAYVKDETERFLRLPMQRRRLAA